MPGQEIIYCSWENTPRTLFLAAKSGKSCFCQDENACAQTAALHRQMLSSRLQSDTAAVSQHRPFILLLAEQGGTYWSHTSQTENTQGSQFIVKNYRDLSEQKSEVKCHATETTADLRVQRIRPKTRLPSPAKGAQVSTSHPVTPWLHANTPNPIQTTQNV